MHFWIILSGFLLLAACRPCLQRPGLSFVMLVENSLPTDATTVPIQSSVLRPPQGHFCQQTLAERCCTLVTEQILGSRTLRRSVNEARMHVLERPGWQGGRKLPISLVNLLMLWACEKAQLITWLGLRQITIVSLSLQFPISCRRPHGTGSGLEAQWPQGCQGHGFDCEGKG